MIKKAKNEPCAWFQENAQTATWSCCSFAQRGVVMAAAFDYRPSFCQFETGVDGIARFDAHLEVYDGLTGFVLEQFRTRTFSFAMDARRFILFITTMKHKVPSTNPRSYSRRLMGFRLKLLFICAASAFAFGLNSPTRALEPGKIWVASWTTSSQGPYPAGWAVAQPVLSFAFRAATLMGPPIKPSASS